MPRSWRNGQPKLLSAAAHGPDHVPLCILKWNPYGMYVDYGEPCPDQEHECIPCRRVDAVDTWPRGWMVCCGSPWCDTAFIRMAIYFSWGIPAFLIFPLLCSSAFLLFCFCAFLLLLFLVLQSCIFAALLLGIGGKITILDQEKSIIPDQTQMYRYYMKRIGKEERTDGWRTS